MVAAYPASPAPALPSTGDPTAVFGRRVVAFLIDAALLVVPAILLFSATFEYLDVDQLGRDPQVFCDDYMDEVGGFCVDLVDVNDRVYFSEGPDALSSAALWGGGLLLHVVLQGLTGFTIGKLVTGLRTVRQDGSVPGLGRAFARWLLLVVDGQPCGLPLVGFFTALTTTGHRRVGDMAAKTFVVRASAAGSPISVPGLTTAPAAPGPAPAWGAPATVTPPAGAPAGAPQWDAARGTYIQWDVAQGRWLQWDEATRTWSPIPGQ